MLKKSEVLREGYFKGLRHAKQIINEMLAQSQVLDSIETLDAFSTNDFDAASDEKNPNMREQLGQKLIDACINGDCEKVSALLNEVDVNFRDAEMITPLHWAIYHEQTKICSLLIDAGADVNAADENGWTPLHEAAYVESFEICEMLLECGANVNAKQNDGETPLFIANKRGNKEICNLLRQYGAKY